MIFDLSWTFLCKIIFKNLHNQLFKSKFLCRTYSVTQMWEKTTLCMKVAQYRCFDLLLSWLAFLFTHDITCKNFFIKVNFSHQNFSVAETEPAFDIFTVLCNFSTQLSSFITQYLLMPFVYAMKWTHRKHGQNYH